MDITELINKLARALKTKEEYLKNYVLELKQVSDIFEVYLSSSTVRKLTKEPIIKKLLKLLLEDHFYNSTLTYLDEEDALTGVLFDRERVAKLIDLFSRVIKGMTDDLERTEKISKKISGGTIRKHLPSLKMYLDTCYYLGNAEGIMMEECARLWLIGIKKNGEFYANNPDKQKGLDEVEQILTNIAIMLKNNINEEGYTFGIMDPEQFLEIRLLLEKTLMSESNVIGNINPSSYKVEDTLRLCLKGLIISFDKPIEEDQKEVPEMTIDENSSLRELSKFIRNNEIIATCDISCFKALLEECHIDDETLVKKMIKKIREEEEEERETEKISFLSLEQANLFLKLKGTNQSKDIAEILNLIDLSLEIIVTHKDEDNNNYLLEIRGYFAELDELLNQSNEECVREERLIYASNGSSIPYALLDINDDPGLDKELILQFLDKLRKGHRGKAKILINDSIPNTSYPLFQYYGQNVRIFFIEVEPSLFVIVGIDSIKKGYRKITNRLINDDIKKIINDIVESLNSPLDRSVLLKQADIDDSEIVSKLQPRCSFKKTISND